MDTKTTLESIAEEEFAEVVEQYISWASEWDGALPADAFFGVWADLHREKKALEIGIHIVDNQVKLTAPPESALKIVDNHLYLEDGRELILHLESVT